MHVLTLTAPLDVGKPIGIIQPGEWVVTDQNAFELANMAARGTVSVRPFKPEEEVLNDVRPDLIVRSGAIGDLLMLTPVFRVLAATPGKPNLCCFPHHFSLFGGNPDIGELVPYPLALSEVPRFHEIISLENTMECDHTQHPTDIFAEALGVEARDHKPIYHVKVSEKVAARAHLFTQRPNIALQLKASVANRDYPLPHWMQVIAGLEKRGWGVLLLGAKGQIPTMPPHMRSPFVKDLSALGLTIRESAAVLSVCDAFIGIDSAFLHFAHALDIPAVGLFGPFRWQVRTGNAPKIRALSGEGECAGCSWHRHNGRVYPPGKPCSTVGHCVVLASIKPERIVALAERLKPTVLA